MALTRRRKTVLAVLVLYWPVLFVLTHIPVPEVVRAAHMSDKSLHLLAYGILAFLLWSVVGGGEKVNWREPTVWCVLVGMMAYGLVDEWLQRYVAGRSTDGRDLLADGIGTVAALAVLTVLGFWPASLIVAGTTIYTLNVLTRANVTALVPVTSTVFHCVSYAIFALLWMGYMRHALSVRRAGRVWAVIASSVPAALLLVTTLSAVVSGKAFEGWDVAAGAAGILCAVVAVSVAGRCGRKERKAVELMPTEG
jgi:VanZ family protein